MSELNTFEEVETYRQLHGMDGLRMMIYQGTLAGNRRQVVEHYIKHFDAEQELQKERERAAVRETQAARSLEASERAAAAAERSADATETAAVASKVSARYAMYAVIVAVVAVIVTVAIDLYRRFS